MRAPDAESKATLLQLRARVKEIATRIAARRHDVSSDPDEPSLQLLTEVDDRLAQTHVFMQSLNRAVEQWDELDHLLAKLLLRDLTDVAEGLRRVLAMLEAQLLRVDSQVQPLTAAIDKAIEAFDRDQEKSLAIERRYATRS
jgi:hypothetical protein